MSRNGSGTYILPTGNPVVTGTTITSNWANTTLSDIGTALTGSIAADGQTPITGDLQMGNNKITALGAPAATTDAANKYYVDTAIATATSVYGTMAVQNANNVAITGGTITGLSSALPVASGGTGLTAPGTTGYVLTSNGTSWVSAVPFGGYKGQVFTSSSTFTIPAIITAVKVTIVGGGGGAGCAVGSGGGGNATAGGGGGGGAAVVYLTGLTPGNTITVTVGSGGSGGTVNYGSTGGTSSISSGTETITTVSATGGAGGAGGAGDYYWSGGAGGIGSNGNANIAGGPGGNGYAANASAVGGNGGSSILGGGNIGTSNSGGNAGRTYGSGAAGGYANGGVGYNGAAGASGIVIFEW